MSATTLPLVAARSPAQLAMRRFLHRPAAVAGLFVITVFIVLAVFAPMIAPADPIQTRSEERRVGKECRL